MREMSVHPLVSLADREHMTCMLNRFFVTSDILKAHRTATFLSYLAKLFLVSALFQLLLLLKLPIKHYVERWLALSVVFSEDEWSRILLTEVRFQWLLQKPFLLLSINPLLHLFSPCLEGALAFFSLLNLLLNLPFFLKREFLVLLLDEPELLLNLLLFGRTHFLDELTVLQGRALPSRASFYRSYFTRY
jgi:hypothetical protein